MCRFVFIGILDKFCWCLFFGVSILTHTCAARVYEACCARVAICKRATLTKFYPVIKVKTYRRHKLDLLHVCADKDYSPKYGAGMATNFNSTTHFPLGPSVLII